ncbi:T9SS type A sorting domain-containing protein [Niastella caeni]|uniref:T9SS type A sorting domain-containing protein n=1 Tax=Niastella caeni TaxID=2569763 RepID=A0A4S8HUV3_9BACT|nr:T9SS type A sorting domain-containing protein [Niastella caeni]THU39350.1 T9SS type A sorting domain-containing protein [Niastella caeni]
MKRISLFWLCMLLAGQTIYAQSPIFTYGSGWLYLDNGTDQGTAWRSLSYNDSSWKTGNGKFGYGLSGLTTIVSYGPNPSQKYITTYFRKKINITNPANFTSFAAGVLRDDGIVVYVNGVEVYRNKMPTGSINYLTFGKDAEDNGSVTQAFTINKTAFVSGNNVIAVEIHQKTVTNADLAFDMQLSGNGAIIDLTPPIVTSIRRQVPASQLTSDTTVTFRSTFSEKVRGVDTGDFILTTVSGTASGVLAESAVVGTDSLTYDITVNNILGNGTLRLDLKGSGTGITDTADNEMTTGFTNGETYFIEQSGAPIVTSINRQLPASEQTDTNAVTFRVVFSKKVKGVDAADFNTFTSGGNVRGTLTKVGLTAINSSLPDAVKMVGTDSTTYDVTVRAIAGSGTIRLDVKDHNTGITDAAGTALAGGFTNGQTYTVNITPSLGFSSFQDITPMNIGSATRVTPQAKVWNYAGKWWAVLTNSDGTKVFRLDGSVWTDVLTLVSATNSRADCRVVGNLAHVLLLRGAGSASYFISLEYDPALQRYKRWTQRTSTVNIVFESGNTTATLDIDSTSRIWIASNSNGNMLVRWSDPPYSTFSAPITIASGATNNDICAVTALPGRIGVLWSNQNTRLFGFKTHVDGASPTTWSADEAPASQSALNVGDGMGDFQMNLVAASDSTLYCAVKTAYDKNGYPTIALLVRRPNNTWDNLHPVTSSKEGDRPFVVLNEAAGKVKVFYTTHLSNEDGSRSGDIMYRESSTATISFGAPVTFMSGNGINSLIYTSSTHQTYNPSIVVITTNESLNPSKALGVLATDPVPPENLARAASSPVLPMALPDNEMNGDSYKVKWLVRPNPFAGNAIVDFSLPLSGRYSIMLYDSKGSMIRVIRQAYAEAGVRNIISFDGSCLAAGLYLVKIQTEWQVQTMKLLKK